MFGYFFPPVGPQLVVKPTYILNNLHEPNRTNLEDTELLLASSAGLWGVFHNVETNGLGEGSALANGHNVSFLDTNEGRGKMGRDVGVALFETVVFGYIVEIVSSDNDGPLHLCRSNDAPQNSASNAHETSERALLVDVVSADGGLGGLETQANVPDEPGSGLLGDGLTFEETAVLHLEDVGLFLVSSFALYVEFNAGHDGGCVK